MENYILEATFTFKSKCFITLYNDIYIYYTYDYVYYTYFTVYVEECVCFEIFRLTSGLCVFVCVCCVHVYVVYEDTDVYNDMGMTGITRRR